MGRSTVSPIPLFACERKSGKSEVTPFSIPTGGSALYGHPRRDANDDHMCGRKPLHTDYSLRYKSVLTYFNPESIINVTTVAAGPSLCAIRMAAWTFPPEDVPAKTPSFPANCRAISLASAVFTDRISSTIAGSHRGGG